MTKEKVTVFIAKKFRTMDPGRPEADAVAVLNGRILSLGTIDQMQPWLSRYDVTVDETLKDKIVLPGLIEPHSHCWMSAGFMAVDYIGPLPWPGREGMNPAHPHFDDVIEYLGELHETKKEGEPIIAWGFDPANQGGSIDRDTLDKITATRPIYILGFAPHFAYLNSAAIEMANVADGANPTHILQYPDGRLNGVFTEVEGVSIGIAPIMPIIAQLGGVDGLKFFGQIALKAGITTVADLMFGVMNIDAELNDHETATEDPNLPIRFCLKPHAMSFVGAHGDKASDVVWELAKHEKDNLFIGGVKFLSDGSFPLMGALLNFPGYLDGGNGFPGDATYEGMVPFWKGGHQIHCHANGDQAVDFTLDLLARLQAEHPRFDHRFTIEHYAMSNPMQARRLKALGGNASVNNYFSHFRALLHSENAYGPDRAQTEARLGSLEKEGVIFALHSDYPQVVVPMHPLTAVYAAVTRLAEDEKTVVAPGERISVERALRAVTIDAAYILNLENEIGSLEVGKFADFCVLEEDPMEVEPEKIKDIGIWGTVLGGRVIEAPND
ncbi:amidohydrolase [Ruegeria sp. HU-ET01832]|uniref:amidohydrolase n=1 Tax=Ruegeria sp. HU-ET01832 TaxID=3135906 RepID=UPI00147D555F